MPPGRPPAALERLFDVRANERAQGEERVIVALRDEPEEPAELSAEPGLPASGGRHQRPDAAFS